MTKESQNQNKSPLSPEVLEAVKGAVKEALAEMSQTDGQTSYLTRDELGQLLDEKLATLSQGDHEHGGDPDCQECLQVAHNAQERARSQGIADATHFFENIPGVAQLHQQYKAAQDKVTVAR